MKVNLKILIIIIITSFHFKAYGQLCSINDTIPIIDLDTTVLSVYITSALNNDLSFPEQGVESVEIKFEHLKLSNVNVDLVSPGGQRVRLIGASTSSGSGTQNVRWDVDFYRQDLPVTPDDNFNERWSNDNDWLAFNNYTGSYYPLLGALDDINSGSVVGEWRLEVIDNIVAGNSVDPSTGDPFSFVSKFSLSFRDNDLIQCATCNPTSSTLLTPSITGCVGNERLEFLLDYEVEESGPYDYGHIIVSDEDDTMTFVDDDNVDLTGLSTGDYTLCGIQYFVVDRDIIQSDTYQDLTDKITSNIVCGKVSDNCIKIQLNDAPIMETVTYDICEGEMVSIQDVDYTEGGTYEIATNIGPYCDSISLLVINLDVIDVEITPSHTQLTCEDPIVTLTPTNLTDEMTYVWEAVSGGIIDTEDENGVITVTSAGVYRLSLELGDCSKEIEYTMTGSDNFNSISLEGENIYCVNDQPLIRLIFDGDIGSLQWSSDDGSPFTPIGNDIMVTVPGIYRVSVVNTSGCEYESEYEVIEDIDDVSSSVNSFELNCDDQTIEVSILGLNVDDEYTITWMSGTTTVFSGNSYVIEDAGTYEVVIVNTTRGCISLETIEVTSIKPDFNVIINAPDITCLVDTVTLEYLSLGDANVIGTKWYKDEAEISQDLSVRVTMSGMYTLVLESDEGCTYTEIFEVKDGTLPEIIILDDVIKSCISDVNLVSQVDSDYDYSWRFPDGTIVEEDNPIATIIGTYQLLATSLETGCVSMATMEVVNDDSVMPSFTFDVNTLTCNNPTPTITPSSFNGFSFDWNGPSITSGTNIPVVTVSQSGSYEVEITNENNPTCKSKYLIDVDEDTNNSIELSAETLNCVRDSAQLFINSTYTFSNIQWSGPAVSDRFAEEPFVRIPTQYYVLYTLSENGCQGLDSITVVNERSQPFISLVSVSKDSIQCDDEVEIEVEIGLSEAQINSVTWSGPGLSTTDTETVDVTEPGTFRVIAIGRGECADTLEVVIHPDTLAPINTLSKSNDILCNNLESMISVVPPTSYQSFEWLDSDGLISDQNEMITVDEVGTYFFRSKYDNNCFSYDSISVLDNRMDPVYEILPERSITCESTDLEIGITAEDSDYILSWMNNEGPISGEDYTISVNTIGTYYFNIRNDQECEVRDSIIVTIDTIRPEFEILISNDISCRLDSAIVKVIPAIETWNYQWEGAGVTGNNDSIQLNESGIFNIEVRADNGCKTKKEFSIQVDTATMNIIDVYADPLSCMDASYLHVDTDEEVYYYQWTGPGTYLSDESDPILLNGGTYTISVAGENGCETYGSIEILDDRLFPILEMSDVYLRCDGNPSGFIIDTIPEGSRIVFEGIGFDYFEEGFDATTTIAGMYEAIAINEVGCQVRDTFEVIEEEFYPIFSVDADKLHCDGANIYAIDAEDDESVRWTGPGGFISTQVTAPVLELGIYELVVTSIFGCSDTVTVEVLDGRVYPNINIIQEALFQCNTEEITLFAEIDNLPSSGLAYAWSSNDGGEVVSGQNNERVTIGSLGNYQIIVTDNETTCKDTALYNLIAEEQSFTNIQYETASPTCKGYDNGIIEITDFIGDYPPYSTVVNGFNYGEQTEIKYLSPGEYVLEMTDAVGCVLSETVIIEEAIDPIITLPSDTTIYEGSVLTFTAGLNIDLTEIDTLIWTGIAPSDDLFREEELFSGTEITLLVIDNDGCMVEESFRVGIIQPESPFPNVFTPNGDRDNDFFYIPSNPAFESILDFKIYDNWGSLIYDRSNIEPGDETSGWDGDFRGKKADQAVYVAYIVVKLKKGDIKKYFTTVTLIR